VNLIIHPGMAFGTGQHATTRGCLELIEEVTNERRIARALDVGTGSGILSIALAKLGVAEVCALDIDPLACAIARENRSERVSSSRVTDDWRAIRGPSISSCQPLHRLAREFAEARRPARTSGRLVCSLPIADEPFVVAATKMTVMRREEEAMGALMSTEGAVP
jgi:SAM-dependent methyltransferase